MDYKDTLNLPQTDFSMKANLPEKEPQILKRWQELGIYRLMRDKYSQAPKGKFILHDGPPYANGDIHIGHALNKILKDIIVKFKTMQGYDAPFVPGWDCHGLPVEHELFKRLGISRSEVSRGKFRKRARDFALKYVEIQKEQFKRLGVFGDWENPYLTLDPAYESHIIKSFGMLVKEGFIYKGLKPVNWCFECETALAEAEVEYREHTSPSIFVKFKLLNTENVIKNLIRNTKYPEKIGDFPGLSPRNFVEIPEGEIRNTVSFVIWTTTPWTLIANVAIALHPELEYALVKTSGEILIMAKGLTSPTMKRAGISSYEIIGELLGKELENLECKHPFIERKVKVVLVDYVSNLEGTGCVHTAPGHGQEDYLTGLKYKLGVIMPVDAKGNFDSTAGEFSGMNVYKANKAIISKLESKERLLFQEETTHSYPHCWRCKQPIIFRATEQWFMSIDHQGLRKRTLAAINEDIKWVPSHGQERIYSMVLNRPDWCLSRQRLWGVPIPVLYCQRCNHHILESGFIDNVAEAVKVGGSDIWFSDEIKKLLPAGAVCRECGSKNFIPEMDIIDVWFDSGVSHYAVLKTRADLDFPADLYLEGSDQHRGWFQSALITGISCDTHKAPFKSVLTHGFVVDGEGKKMSKSLGNVISPADVIERFGADVLRLWVAASDYNDDVRISEEILSRLSEAYRKIRNTCRFILGNLYDFDPEKDRVDYAELEEIDKWALFKVQRLLINLTRHYESYSFHRVFQGLYNFCTVEMSSFYLDVLKDRLYVSHAKSKERRSAQTAIYEIIRVVQRLMAPILAYTAEEIGKHLLGEEDLVSIYLAMWPEEKEKWNLSRSKELEWIELINLRKVILYAIEEAREKKVIGNSLEARLILHPESLSGSLFNKYNHIFAELFIVSQVEISSQDWEGEWRQYSGYSNLGHRVEKRVKVKVKPARGSKCKRCWKWSEAVGKDEIHPSLCPRCVEIVKQMT